MSYELVEEVLDHAGDMTPAEGLVLVAIAEKLRRPGGTIAIGTAELSRRSRLNPAGLRKAIARLANRGIEVRVPLAKDKRGEKLYAVPGKVPVYKLPRFAAPIGCDCENCQNKAIPEDPLPEKPQVGLGDPQGSPSEGDPQGSAAAPTGSAADPQGSPTHAMGSPTGTPMAMPDAAAAHGATSPGDEHNHAGAEHDVPLPAEEARARARAAMGVVGKGKPASKWKPYRSSEEGPNPHHDPAARVAALRLLDEIEGATAGSTGGDAA